MSPEPPAAAFAAALARPRPDDRAAVVRDWLAAGGRAADLRPSLEAALADPDADVRRRAVRLVAEVPSEEAFRGPVLAALADPAWVVREAAAAAAERLPDLDRSVHGCLVTLALHDPRPQVREAVAAAAGPRSEPEQDYGAAARHGFERQRIRAALALGFAPPAEAVPVLRPLLDDSHAKVRRAALLGLARLPADAVLPLLPAVVRKGFEADPAVAAAAADLRRRLLAHPAAAPLAAVEVVFAADGPASAEVVAELVAADPFRAAWEAVRLWGVTGPPHGDLPRVLARLCERVLSAGAVPPGGLAPPSPGL